MERCSVCGEQIVFRYVDGRPTPIHVNGNWCRGYVKEGSDGKGSGPFGTASSYVTPNATCPVCGETVFFYQAPSGGRVFFDDLGWPWPKHPCTDNQQKVGRPHRSKKKRRVRLNSGNSGSFKSRGGSRLAVYSLEDVEEKGDQHEFIFRRIGTNKLRTGVLKVKTMEKGGLSLTDFYDAPSFVIDVDNSDDQGLRVDFICARLGKIVRIRMSK
jgi:hypothetical protein